MKEADIARKPERRSKRLPELSLSDPISHDRSGRAPYLPRISNSPPDCLNSMLRGVQLFNNAVK